MITTERIRNAKALHILHDIKFLPLFFWGGFVGVGEGCGGSKTSSDDENEIKDAVTARTRLRMQNANKKI